MKKLLRCTLTALGLLCVCNLHAQTTTWADDTDTSWYSSDATSFTITTAQQLAGLASLVNAGTTFEGCTVTVANDIDLSGKEWIPIGQKEAERFFKGTFTASGTTNVTISGLTITTATSSITDDSSTFDGYVGLFGAIEDATISYITVNGSITGKNAAGIVARMNGGTISNCINNATITATTKGGGIVCLSHGDYTNVIQNCSNTGTITGNSASGGMGGILAYGNGNTTVTNCSNTASVTNSSNYAGGIVGYASGSNASATSCTNTGAVSSTLNAGGIFGISTASWNGTSCTNSGAISATGTNGSAGGIAGSLASGTLTSCSNTATVSGAIAGGVTATMGGNSALVNCSGGTATITGATYNGRLVGYVINGAYLEYPSRLTLNDSNGDDTTLPTIGCIAPYTGWTYVIVLSGTLHGTPVKGNQAGAGIVFASGAKWDAQDNLPEGGSMWFALHTVTTLALTPVATYNGTSYYNINSAIEAAVADGSTEAATIKLTSDFAENVVIPAEANIILDLNNQRLLDTGSHTITNYGTLQVINSSTSSDKAVVDAQTHAKAALYNAVGATATLSAGTYTRTKEASISAKLNGGNSFYTIQNLGTMTIDNAAVTVTQGGTGGKYSSLIENGWYDGSQNTTGADSTLTISAGTFTGGLNTIKNDDYGVLTISGGTFSNTAQHTILNWNEATISDGTFSSSNAVIANGYGNDTMDKGTLTITGGTFTTTSTTASVIAQAGSNIGTVAISGGTYSTDVSDYCVEGYTSTQNEDGTYGISEATYVASITTTDGTTTKYTTLQAAIDAAASGDTVTLLMDVDLGTLENPDSDTGLLSVVSGQSLALDLAGYTISGSLVTTSNTYARAHIILNSGNLTITDSSTDHTGEIVNTNTSSHGCTRTIKNLDAGTLTINGGTVRATSGVALLNLGTCTITGDNTLLIAEQEGYTGGWDNGVAGVENRVSAVMTISGGTLKSVSESGLFADGGRAIITGGTIIGSSTYGAMNGSPASYITVTGGTFSSDPTVCVDTTAYVVTTSDTMYVVQAANAIEDVTITTVEELVSYLSGTPDPLNPKNLIIAGDLTLSTSLTLPSTWSITINDGYSLAIADSTVLTLEGTLTNNGTLTVPGSGFISGIENLTGTISGMPTVTDGVYTVSTAMELQWLTVLLDDEALSGITSIVLANDITIPEGAAFTCLGTIQNITFDGQNHSIKTLNIDCAGTDGGLFYFVADSIVKDVTLDVNVTSDTGYVGGVAYCSLTSTFENVTVTGSVQATGASYGVGGIVGSVYYLTGLEGTETVFANCTVDATIGGTAAYNVGSIFGTASGCSSDIGIYNCSTSSAITAMGSMGTLFGFGYLSSGYTLEVINYETTATVNGTAITSDTDTYYYSSAQGSSYTFDTTYASTDYTAVQTTDGDWVVGVASVTTTDGTTTYYATLQAAITAAPSGATVTLLTNTTEDITVPSTASLTLDLNGCTLTNSSDHTITNNGTLTIVDSSTDHSGVVDNVTHTKAAIYNAYGATATLSGGTYDRSKEASSSGNNGGNSYYTIQNLGNMTISGENVVVKQSGTGGYYSSLIINGDGSATATMTISAGTFTGGLNTVKNGEYGVLKITGGTFTNSVQCVVLNWHIATISGGTFTASGSATSTIRDGVYNENAIGQLTITDGTFIAPDGYDVIRNFSSTYPAGKVSVSAGEFSKLLALEYCADGYLPVSSSTEGMYTVSLSTDSAKYVAAVASTTADGTYTGYTSIAALLADSNVVANTSVVLVSEPSSTDSSSLTTTTAQNTTVTGVDAYTRASLLGGSFKVGTGKESLVYDYDLGISAITVTTNTEGTQVANVSVMLTEENTPVARTLTGQWIVLTVTNGSSTKTYASNRSPTFGSAGTCVIEVPYSDLTSGTNAVTLKITDTDPTSSTTAL